MSKIKFTKMVASGNDFIVIDKLYSLRYPLNALTRKICDRKFGVGADGLLVLEKSKKADMRMRIFNADGSEAEMCGNGARCAALFVSRISYLVSRKRKTSIETKAGIINAEVNGGSVKIKLTDPKDIKADIPVILSSRKVKVNFVNTGVPHTVVFVEGLEKIDVFSLGRIIRNHKQFAPKGTNVNFVEVMDKDSIKVRTYERGVEDETLACGTGSVASALLYALRYTLSAITLIKVFTKGGEVLKVYFDREKNNFKNVWLEGKAKIIAQGEYYV